MTDERMPPREARIEAFLESLADVTVPGDLAGAVASGVRARPSRRPSFRLPVLAAAAGLLLTVSVAMAAGWRPPFDVLPGPQVTLAPAASPVATAIDPTPAPPEPWEWATLAAQDAEVVIDPVTREPAGPSAESPDFDAVLVRERRVVAGRTWVRIEQGGYGGEARFVWIPEQVPSIAPTGHPVNTLVPTTWTPCDTSGPPTIEALASLTAAQRLACAGGTSFTIGPVEVAQTWDDTANTGTPDWLAGPITTMLQAPIHASGRVAIIPVRVKPGTGITLLADTWVTVTAHFDDPASGSCVRRTTEVSGAPVGEPSDHVLWCRQQLVVTAATEVPAPTPPSPTPVPYETFGGVTTSLPDAPIDGRVGESAAWTGTELVIWGGEHRPEQPLSSEPPADGAALDVHAGTWRMMAASPLAGRSGALSAWSGSEVLIWGGSSTADDRWLEDGAAWNPSTDTWRRLPEAPLEGGFPQVAAWAGDRWFVGSGTGLAAYDPVTDRWSRGPDLPIGAEDVVRMAWAGDRLALLTQSLSGADLWTIRPGEATWVPLGQAPVLDVPARGTAFDGSRLWLVGASDGGSAAGGQAVAAWDPVANAWEIVDSPVSTEGSAAAWNGSHLIVVSESGGAYDPGANDWLLLPGGGTDRDREDPSVVWAGDRLLVWGGGWGERSWTKPDGWQLPWDLAGG